jgi:hypothetical protein
MHPTVCPHCSQRQAVAAKRIGQDVRCRSCTRTFRAEEAPDRAHAVPKKKAR